MTTENENTYPGLKGSDMAVVCDERIYSFYAMPDLRALAKDQTYLIQVEDVPGPPPGQSTYKFYESLLDIGDGGWVEVVRSAQQNGSNTWAVVVESNDLTPTGGTMVLWSRTSPGKNRLKFVYDNIAGHIEIGPVAKE